MATRRGFGTLRRLPSKRWQATYVGPDLQRHSAPHTFGSTMDAEVCLAQERTLASGEDWVAPRRRGEIAERLALPTFGEYAGQWLADRSLKPRTREGYEHLLRRYLEPEFGELLVADLTPALVRRWWAGLAPEHPTVNARAYALLRAILSTAVTDELLAGNPCRVRAASNPPTTKEIRPATLAELDVLVKEMPDQLGALVLLCAWCALRVGEVLELRRRDLDLNRGVLKVTRAVSWVRGQPIIGTPKSAAGTREVSVPLHIVPALKQHLERHARSGGDALLFPSMRDHQRHLQPTVLHTAWRKARAAAGRDDLRIHDLRHTGATMAAMTGATLAELQARLGHSTVAALRCATSTPLKVVTPRSPLGSPTSPVPRASWTKVAEKVAAREGRDVTLITPMSGRPPGALRRRRRYAQSDPARSTYIREPREVWLNGRSLLVRGTLNRG